MRVCLHLHAHHASEHASTRTRAHEYRREWESYKIRTLRVDTARLLCIHASTPTSYARAIVCVHIRQMCAWQANANMCKRRRLGRICKRCGYDVPNAIQHRSLYPVHRYGSITPARKWYRMLEPVSRFRRDSFQETRNNFRNASFAHWMSIWSFID